ncbi:unnamed protein product [Dibothriocephalus latus]|uniref:tRNA selenocysteine-associated protein 1 n=1 Tax=Dibothriocephalus latus TaxID=60516 RepID=A0A3P7P831_DIBLA|nr:unnamed protein product [Dibothriocephalus latus]
MQTSRYRQISQEYTADFRFSQAMQPPFHFTKRCFGRMPGWFVSNQRLPVLHTAVGPSISRMPTICSKQAEHNLKRHAKLLTHDMDGRCKFVLSNLFLRYFQLEPYMDETFIRKAFDFHDEKVVSVKIIRNKTRRFKLNHASYGKDSSSGYAFCCTLLITFPLREFSLFVGELTEDVDDLALFNAFKKYPSCRSAKVVMNNGKSRGYGFVRFSSESDQDKALIEMQNFCGLGYKPIRVSLAIPKRYTMDGNLILGTGPETSSSLIPSGELLCLSRCFRHC